MFSAGTAELTCPESRKWRDSYRTAAARTAIPAEVSSRHETPQIDDG